MTSGFQQKLYPATGEHLLGGVDVTAAARASLAFRRLGDGLLGDWIRAIAAMSSQKDHQFCLVPKGLKS